MEEKIKYILENLPKKRALLVGFFSLLLVFLALDNFIEKICPNALYRLLGYLSVHVGWFVFWLYKKNILPKNSKNKIGLVICINAENDKQKIRIKNDFAGRLDKLILGNNLGKIVNIILLNSYQAERVSKVLDQYVKNKYGKEELKNWNSIQKSMRSHFFIYGNIKERQDVENKYFIDLEALVVHAPVNVPIKKQIKKEFLSVWYKQISFQEKIEFKGFEFTADSIFVAVEYIVGIAALVSGDIELALKLHNNLNNNPYFQKFTPLPPNLKHVKEELKSLLAEENYLIARYHYKQGNLEKCNNYLNQSFLIQQSYGALLLRSIIEFCNENNSEKALNTIYESKKLAKNDGTWRYSEGFLLMYLEKYDKAVKVYKKIIENSYPGEESTLKEVYIFIENILKNNPDKIQLYFVLGYLKYRKDSNYPEAYDYFEKFLSKANNNYDFLIVKVKSYKAELEHKMKI